MFLPTLAMATAFLSRARRPGKTGRKTIAPEVITLVRNMNHANPLCGAPRIHGELLKLSITLAQRNVAYYMVPRARRPTAWNPASIIRMT